MKQRQESSAIPPAVLVGTMLMLWSFSTQATAVEIEKQAAIAANTANAVCGEIPVGGSDQRGSVEANVEAKLPTVLKRLGLNAGVSAQVKGEAGGYKGPSRNDLPAVLKNDQDCRKNVAFYVLDFVRLADRRSESNNRASSTATSSAVAKTGDIALNQNVGVTVNGQAATIPPFTITGDQFGMNTYRVVPDPLPTTSVDAVEPDTSIELIKGLPRVIGKDTSLTFVQSADLNGHPAIALQSRALWPGRDLYVAPGRALADAILIPEHGEPMYINLEGRVYYLTVDSPRQPNDGSELRVMIHVSKTASEPSRASPSLDTLNRPDLVR